VVGWLGWLVGEKLMTLTLSMVAGDFELGDKTCHKLNHLGHVLMGEIRFNVWKILQKRT